jgi:hypothetical protein
MSLNEDQLGFFGLRDDNYRPDENVVHYELHPVLDTHCCQIDIGNRLDNLLERIISHVQVHTGGYIWQRDAFNLRVSSSPRSHTDVEQPFFTGSVHFEDNIEDEWFVTWLLLDITRNFPVSARVRDNDGDFILIEAAYYLPRYLKPDVATNRIWLHAGNLHIIPPTLLGAREEAGSQETRQLTVPNALELVHRYPEVTRKEGRDPFMKAISKRLEGYPEKAKRLMHRARAWVPLKVAHLLSITPQTVAAAVSAFYLRDPSDVQVASRMEHFPPEAMVLTSVTFNRCLYAQISLQDFSPCKGWPDSSTDKMPQYRNARLLGAKLCTGFEILMARRGCNSPPYGANWVSDIVKQRCDSMTLDKAKFNGDVPPSDSEDWLFENNANEVEKELERRENELIGTQSSKGNEFDPDKLSSKFKDFLGIMDSSSELVNVGEEELVAQLQQVLGIKPIKQMPAEEEDPNEDESSEGSSFYAFGSESDDNFNSGDEKLDGGCEWADASTATDSDDEYSLRMNEELATTTLAHTFTKANEPGTTANANRTKGDQESKPAKEVSSNVVAANQLDPIDIDFNLVDSLLASHREQGGLAGPASSLAGLLRVHLPPQD